MTSRNRCLSQHAHAVAASARLNPYGLKVLPATVHFRVSLAFAIVALEVDGVEAVEHCLQRLRREEVLQLVRGDDLLQLRAQALLDVGVVAAARGCLLERRVLVSISDT